MTARAASCRCRRCAGGSITRAAVGFNASYSGVNAAHTAFRLNGGLLPIGIQGAPANPGPHRSIGHTVRESEDLEVGRGWTGALANVTRFAHVDSVLSDFRIAGNQGQMFHHGLCHQDTIVGVFVKQRQTVQIEDVGVADR